MKLYTIGHSTHPITEFIEMLKGRTVTLLVDVRTVPGSRHNPQFNEKALAASLDEAGLGYIHMAGLGGFRKASPDSVNAGWKNGVFRGYADYMQTDEFKKAIDELIAQARDQTVAVMCSEAVPWRCHRSLIADALLVRDIEVVHIMGEGKDYSHKLTPFALVNGLDVTYPPDPMLQVD